MRPPVRYYGGKTRLAGWIASLLPSLRVYLEPFASGCALLTKAPATKLVNDLDGNVVAFFRCLRDDAGEYASEAGPRHLAEVLHATPTAVVLAGYPSPLCDELYADCDRLDRRVHLPSSNGGRGDGHAVEVVWSNRALPAHQRLARQEARA